MHQMLVWGPNSVAHAPPPDSLQPCGGPAERNAVLEILATRAMRTSSRRLKPASAARLRLESWIHTRVANCARPSHQGPQRPPISKKTGARSTPPHGCIGRMRIYAPGRVCITDHLGFVRRLGGSSTHTNELLLSRIASEQLRGCNFCSPRQSFGRPNRPRRSYATP